MRRRGQIIAQLCVLAGPEVGQGLVEGIVITPAEGAGETIELVGRSRGWRSWATKKPPSIRGQRVRSRRLRGPTTTDSSRSRHQFESRARTDGGIVPVATTCLIPAAFVDLRHRPFESDPSAQAWHLDLSLELIGATM
jgi:hypothetical protein